jgi:hypothetical protein
MTAPRRHQARPADPAHICAGTDDDRTMCIAGVVYGPCGDVRCRGACTPAGDCDCRPCPTNHGRR